MQIIQRCKVRSSDKNRIVDELLNGLSITAPQTSGRTLTLQEARRKVEWALDPGSDERRFITNHVTTMDLISDGASLKWQDVLFSEAESTGQMFFQSLWSMELKRVAESTYQISSAEVPKNTPRR